MAKISAKGIKVKHGTTAAPTDELAQLKSVGFNQGARELIDTTCHDNTVTKSKLDSGLREPPTITMTIDYDPANAGHEAVRAAAAAGTVYYMTLVLPDAGAAQWAAVGIVTDFQIPDSATNVELQATITFQATAAEAFTQ